MALSYVEQLVGTVFSISWTFAELAPFISAALLCVRMVVARFRAEDPKAEALSDPFLIAYLSGETRKFGAKQVVDVALQLLICKAEITFTNARTLAVAEKAPREETSVIETAVLNQLRLSQGSAEQLKVPEADVYLRDLIRRGLAHDDETRRWQTDWILRPLRVILWGNALLAGLTTFARGLSEQYTDPNAVGYIHVAVGSVIVPGFFLYMFTRLADAITELAATPLRTRAGDSMLRRLEQRYEHLKQFRRSGEALPPSREEFMLIAAVFGLRSLPDSAFCGAPLLKELRSPEPFVMGGS